MQLALAFTLFAATWLLWSGHYSPLLLVLGAVSCAIVAGIASRTGFFHTEVYVFHLLPRLPRFWAWLLKEIAIANWVVARIIMSRSLPRPTIVTIDASRLPPVAQAILANAITLTPGTLSLDVDAGRLEVHCLNPRLAADLSSGEMVRRATALTER
jgi:multicomponent Na+:H+ antiporter subunit E